jgi:hypothetical protein
MQQQFTQEFMQDNCGCYEIEHLNSLSFMKNGIVQLSDIISSEIPVKDKYWFVCKKLATKEQNQQIAIAVAEIVLPIYEKRYNDTRPREAIEAAKQFIAGRITLSQLRQKRYAAADAAAAAADAAAADAAAAAADAAAADAAAAYPAAYAYAADAAYAYAAYAYAADAAAADDDIKQQLLGYLINFCK